VPINRDRNTEMIVRLPRELKQALQNRAESEQIGHSQLVRQAITQYLDLPSENATMAGHVNSKPRNNSVDMLLRRQAKELLKKLALSNPGLLEAILEEAKESFEL
jgi:hypothetical protein